MQSTERKLIFFFRQRHDLPVKVTLNEAKPVFRLRVQVFFSYLKTSDFVL